MAKRTPVTRLDQALRYFEEELYLSERLNQIMIARNGPLHPEVDPLAGLLVHYRDLRSHLLQIGSITNLDTGRFYLQTSAQDQGVADSTNVFVAKMASWVAESRRVYALEEDLQLALLAVNFGSKTVADIPWPLPTFGIQFATPMPLTNKAWLIPETDFLLASKPVVQNVLLARPEQDHRRYVMALNESLERRAGLSPHDYQAIEKMVAQRRNDRHLWKALEKKVAPPGMKEAFAFLSGEPFETAEPTKIETVLRVLEKETSPDNATCWRLIIALCFYISTLSTASPHRSKPYRTARKPHTLDLSAVTEASEICTLASSFVLTPTQREELREYARRGGGWELPFHFRIAHERRPPGKGIDPDWPKSVKVPATTVNLVRRPEKGIAGGTMGKLR